MNDIIEQENNYYNVIPMLDFKNKKNYRLEKLKFLFTYIFL